MADKKATLILFGYDDGSYEYATGEHAQDVMGWLNAAQAMQCIHGGAYRGRPMEKKAASTSDLEVVSSIAERTFPEWVEALREREGKA